MSLYGALAENTRRNERVERGTLTVTGSGTVTAPYPMRQITFFQLTLDDAATPFTTADPVQVSGSLNASGTTLTINVYKLAAGSLAASTTATAVRYEIWGNLSAGQGF